MYSTTKLVKEKKRIAKAMKDRFNQCSLMGCKFRCGADLNNRGKTICNPVAALSEAVQDHLCGALVEYRHNQL
jgi:hypothetical protein